jgi:hypothetical protein
LSRNLTALGEHACLQAAHAAVESPQPPVAHSSLEVAQYSSLEVALYGAREVRPAHALNRADTRPRASRARDWARPAERRSQPGERSPAQPTKPRKPGKQDRRAELGLQVAERSPAADQARAPTTLSDEAQHKTSPLTSKCRGQDLTGMPLEIRRLEVFVDRSGSLGTPRNAATMTATPTTTRTTVEAATTTLSPHHLLLHAERLVSVRVGSESAFAVFAGGVAQRIGPEPTPQRRLQHRAPAGELFRARAG